MLKNEKKNTQNIYQEVSDTERISPKYFLLGLVCVCLRVWLAWISGHARLWHPGEKERRQKPIYSLIQLGNNPLQQQSQLQKLAPTHRLLSEADLHSLAWRKRRQWDEGERKRGRFTMFVRENINRGDKRRDKRMDVGTKAHVVFELAQSKHV